MKTVAFLIFPDFQLLDAAGPISAFEMPTRGMEPAPYQLRILASEAGPVKSSSGALLMAEAIDDKPVDTLFVAGGEGTEQALKDKAFMDFVKTAGTRARRTCSVCSGSVFLAAAGLLDGRSATTHWRRSDEVQRAFPKVNFDAERIWTKDGKFWTSAGITAGIDLSLALIADDLGEGVAQRVAQELVVYYRRPGGQSQFSPLIRFSQTNGKFADLLSWVRVNLKAPLHVTDLAEQAGMSPRNFSRLFLAETGETPARAVERLRLDTARTQVEASNRKMSEIADETGFNDPERMRRSFLRAFGASPQTLRQIARGAG